MVHPSNLPRHRHRSGQFHDHLGMKASEAMITLDTSEATRTDPTNKLLSYLIIHTQPKGQRRERCFDTWGSTMLRHLFLSLLHLPPIAGDSNVNTWPLWNGWFFLTQNWNIAELCLPLEGEVLCLWSLKKSYPIWRIPRSKIGQM